MTEGRGNWIQLRSGRRFYLTDPRPDEVHIEDIAHALGRMCRFNGHCPGFYSVAEHSVHVAMAMLEQYRWHREIALCGLLHDAAEAYLPDVTRPLKAVLPGFAEIEAKVQAAINDRFDLDPDVLGFWSFVRDMDLRMLKTEAVQFEWDISDWDPALRMAVPTRRVLRNLAPAEATRDFLDLFALLGEGRGS